MSANATHAIVQDAFNPGEQWEALLANCVPIVDSGAAGEAGVASVRDHFSKARQHLGRAHVLIKEDAEPEPVVTKPAPPAATAVLPRIHRRLILRALQALRTSTDDAPHWRRFVDVPGAKTLDDAIAMVVRDEREWY